MLEIGKTYHAYDYHGNGSVDIVFHSDASITMAAREPVEWEYHDMPIVELSWRAYEYDRPEAVMSRDQANFHPVLAELVERIDDACASAGYDSDADEIFKKINARTGGYLVPLRDYGYGLTQVDRFTAASHLLYAETERDKRGWLDTLSDGELVFAHVAPAELVELDLYESGMHGDDLAEAVLNALRVRDIEPDYADFQDVGRLDIERAYRAFIKDPADRERFDEYRRTRGWTPSSGLLPVSPLAYTPTPVND